MPGGGTHEMLDQMDQLQEALVQVKTLNTRDELEQVTRPETVYQ